MVELGEELRLARWRMLRRYGMPSEVIEDYLHDAIVIFLEGNHKLDEADLVRRANWLSRVAWYNWLTYRGRLSTRKTQGLDDDQSGAVYRIKDDTGTPIALLIADEERSETESRIRSLMDGSTPKVRETLAIYGRGSTMQETGIALGVTRQCIQQRISGSGA